MIRAAFALLLLLWFCPPAAAQAPRGSAAVAELAITYRSQTSAYVSGGRSAGLALGDRLSVVSGRDTVAELEVVFLAEHSASCRIVSESRPVQPGQRVVRVGGNPASPPAEPSTPAAAGDRPSLAPAAPSAVPGPSAAARSRHDDAPWGRVTGGLSLGGSTFQDASTAAIDVEERFLRYDVAVHEIGGRDLQARLRGSHRRGTRTVAGLAGLQDARDPLYEASLTWAPAGGRFMAAAGRLGAYPFVSLGYLDGVLGAVRPTGGTEFGAFAGRQAGGRPLGLSGNKAGAFFRLKPRTGPGAFDFVATGVREERGGAPTREFLGQEAHARSGKLTLYERVEIDLFRGVRKERAGAAAQLTEARLLASWQATASRFVTLSYERRRTSWDAATRDLPVSVFDDRVHETLRANIHVARIGGAGLWLGGSARRRDADPRTSFSADGGFRTGGVWGMTLSADGSFYQTQYTLGAQATGMLTRDFAGGHRLDVSYTFNRYDLEGPLAFRNNHWARASGYVRLPQRAFLRADLEHGLGDDLKGTRAGLEAGVRF